MIYNNITPLVNQKYSVFKTFCCIYKKTFMVFSIIKKSIIGETKLEFKSELFTYLIVNLIIITSVDI